MKKILHEQATGSFLFAPPEKKNSSPKKNSRHKPMSFLLLSLLNSLASAQSATDQVTESPDASAAEDAGALQAPAIYHTNFHIAGVFIVLAVSAIGTFGAMYLGYQQKIPNRIRR